MEPGAIHLIDAADLLNLPHDLSIRDNMNKSALSYACERGMKEVALALLSRGCSPSDISGRFLLDVDIQVQWS